MVVVVRVWDALLLDMDQTVLFRAMLAVVEQHTQEVLACSEHLALWHKLAGLPLSSPDTASLLEATHYQFADLTRCEASRAPVKHVL
jgi:hypothetical protein